MTITPTSTKNSNNTTTITPTSTKTFGVVGGQHRRHGVGDDWRQGD